MAKFYSQTCLLLLHKLFSKMCFMFHAFRHLMKSWDLNIWKVNIWLSHKWKVLLKWKKKHFTLFHKCSLLDLQKQTGKNVVDTTFHYCDYLLLEQIKAGVTKLLIHAFRMVTPRYKTSIIHIIISISVLPIN